MLAITACIAIIAIYLIYQIFWISHYFPYKKGKSILTSAEMRFYFILEKAMRERYRVFAKIRLADIFDVQERPGTSRYNKAFYKISSKHFDFVLCDRSTLDVVCVVELDDSSHERKDRRERDEFVKEVCRVSQVPLVRIKVSRHYSEVAIRDHIRTVLYQTPEN
jgi:hypothetical protein